MNSKQEVCPIIVADQVCALADQIHFEELPRTGDFVAHEYNRISTRVEQLAEQLEGGLINRILQLLEIITDVLTCTDIEYDTRYQDFWKTADQLRREIVLSYAEVSRRELSI